MMKSGLMFQQQVITSNRFKNENEFTVYEAFHLYCLISMAHKDQI